MKEQLHEACIIGFQGLLQPVSFDVSVEAYET